MSLVVIGKNSKIWGALKSHFPDGRSISHSEVSQSAFSEKDVIMVLSYSKERSENERLLETIKLSPAKSVIYIGSASVKACEVTGIYRYPNVKLAAEKYAEGLGFQVVTIGLFVESDDDLPSGFNVHTTKRDLIDFLGKSLHEFPVSPDLLRFGEKEFSSTIEKQVYRCYRRMVAGSDTVRLLLRPFDFIFSKIRWRWYGYYRLSSDIWNTTL